MTVESQTNKVIAAGNGVATVFSFNPLVLYANTDLTVKFVDASGSETLLTEGTGTTNYSLSVMAYPGTGSITYPATLGTKLQTGEKLVMKPVYPKTQTTDLDNQGGYFPEVQETALDKLTRIDLQQQEEIDRSFKAPASDPAIDLTVPSAAARAGQWAAWSSPDGKLIAASSPGAVPISVPMQSVVAAASVSAALTALGMSTFIKTLIDDADAPTARATLGLDKTVVQTVSTQTGTVATGTTVMPYDDTIPQNTEGDQYMSLAITPRASTNKLRITVTVCGSLSIPPGAIQMALFQDSVANALAAIPVHYGGANHSVVASFTHVMDAGTTSATTFKVRVGGSGAATFTFNGSGGTRLLGGVSASSIVIQEYVP